MTSPKGFTLLEVLVVTVLLGILAAICVPMFSNASDSARSSMLADNLRVWRTQISVFWAEHRDVAPGYTGEGDDPTEALFAAHMTLASKEMMETAAPGTAGFDFGPYMQRIPENPINQKATIQIVPDGQAFPSAPDGSHGWIYKPETLTLKSDCTGEDEVGRKFFGY